VVARLRFGVLGCADIARRRAMPAMAGHPAVELVAVASREAGTARVVAAEHGCAAAPGYRQLIERDDIDAVYLPLPNGLHAEWARRAVAAGKHVLVEKPFAVSHAEAADVVALAQATGRLVAENLMFLHHGQHAYVRRCVVEGVIGEPRSFTAEFGIPGRPDSDVRYRAGLGGGALLDLGGYLVRAARLYLGDAPRALAAHLVVDDRYGVDVDGTVLLMSTVDSTMTAKLTFGFRHGYRGGYALWGSAASLGLFRAFTPPADLAPVLWIERDGRREERPLASDDQWANALGAFAAAAADPTVHADHFADILAQAAILDEVRALATTIHIG
jgi:NDP-hexose-3-ketoreductase